MLLELVLAFISSLAFARIFNVPVKAMPWGGSAGLLAWLGLSVAVRMGAGVIIGTLLGAILVGVVSEVAARLIKAPVSVFIVPGIVPLVPGAVAYAAMLAFVRTEFQVGAARTFEALFSAGAIAAGLILTGSAARALARK